jgi:hypothetical protein
MERETVAEQEALIAAEEAAAAAAQKRDEDRRIEARRQLMEILQREVDDETHGVFPSVFVCAMC